MQSKFITRHEMRFDDREANIIQAALRSDAAKRNLSDESRRSLAIKVGKDRTHIHWDWQLEEMAEAIGLAMENGESPEDEYEEWCTVYNNLRSAADKRHKKI